jgi:hypothetical protein
MTTARVAYSRVESMPLKILSESAALAAGPATWADNPGSPDPAMRRKVVT